MTATNHWVGVRIETLKKVLNPGMTSVDIKSRKAPTTDQLKSLFLNGPTVKMDWYTDFTLKAWTSWIRPRVR